MKHNGLGRIGLTVVLAMLLAAACTSCSALKSDAPERIKRQEQHKVALVLAMRHGDYWKTVYMGAQMAAREYGVGLNLYAPADEEDVKGQVEQVRQALDDGADALVLAANDDDALAGVVDEAAQRVPVIAIDSKVKSSKVKSYIGTDNYEAGRTAAGELVRLLDGKPARIGVLGFVQGTQKAEMREKGFLDTLAKHPEIVVADKKYCYSDQQLAMNLTRRMMEESGPLDAIVALNSIASIGAAETVDKLGMDGLLKVVAFDSTLQELEFLQGGVITAAVVQNPFSMGYLGVRHAVEVLDGRKVPASLDTGSKVIRPDNMFSSENQKLLFPLLK